MLDAAVNTLAAKLGQQPESDALASLLLRRARQAACG
jgi:hypothetical protein